MQFKPENQIFQLLRALSEAIFYREMIPRSILRPRDRSIILARTTFCVSPFSRNMSSATVARQKHEWIVILPDHDGMLQKRMEVRP